MTKEQRTAARERCDKATPGPWIKGGPFQGYCDVTTEEIVGIADAPGSSGKGCSMLEEDADFIAHARQDLPAALDEIERLMVWG